LWQKGFLTVDMDQLCDRLGSHDNGCECTVAWRRLDDAAFLAERALELMIDEYDIGKAPPPTPAEFALARRLRAMASAARGAGSWQPPTGVFDDEEHPVHPGVQGAGAVAAPREGSTVPELAEHSTPHPTQVLEHAGEAFGGGAHAGDPDDLAPLRARMGRQACC
jgi:hypothetical protein